MLISLESLLCKIFIAISCLQIIWCSSTESNCRLLLTMEPLYHLTTRAMVVPTGVEPVTSWMSTKRSTAELRNRYGESYGNRTRINGITIRGVDRYTNNSICGLACRNRTHIQEVEALCIIHYTKARNGRGYWDRTSDDRVKVCSVTATLTPSNIWSGIGESNS